VHRLLRLLMFLMYTPSPALAHPGRALQPGEGWGAWTFDPWVLLAIGLLALLYARGVGRLWRHAGRGRGVREWEFRAFCGGLAALAVALLSPVHALGGVLFSAHMAQHEILILVAAPMLALGAPTAAFAWAFPPRVVRGFHGWMAREPLRSSWRALSHPLGAWSLHAAALWAWHIPPLYEATLRSELAHTAQHVSFFGSAVLFWWVILRQRGPRRSYGLGIAFVFTTMLHSNILGALMTFAARPWYAAYTESAPRWGFTPLEDQQLGGLLMWIPAGMVYLLAGLLLLAGWLRAAERRHSSRPSAPHVLRV
jgi:putative membrane protein